MSTEQSTKPVNYGMLLFPTFQALDVFGPLEVLNTLSKHFHMNLSIIGPSMDPISTAPRSSDSNPFNSSFAETVLPTHTYDNPPPLDVLIIPGGRGTREPGIEKTIEFIRKAYPSVKYIITVCTGSRIAAQAGILDGKRATTNKSLWKDTTQFGNNVQWIPKARWVQDGNIWTSSGVSAGIDATLAFVGEMYGKEVATQIANAMEYDRHEDPSWDPFADLYGLTSTSS